MKIGLDMDEVIVEFVEHMLKFYHLKTGKKIEKNKVTSYDFWEVWGGTREETLKLIDEFHDSDYFDKIHPVENAVESINRLIDKNEIYVITSRPGHFKEKTEEWFKKNFKDGRFKVLFSNDFHKGKGKTKAEICKELGIKLMIEDSLKMSLDCANSGIKVILFDKPWNQGIEHKNITRVHNWIDALKEIDRLNN